MGQERYREAFEDCCAALRRKADYWRARLRRARIAVKLRRFGEALSDFEKYAAQGPEYSREVEGEMRDCRRLAAWEQDRAQYDHASRHAGRRQQSSFGNEGYGAGASRMRPGYASRHSSRSKASHTETGWSRRFAEPTQDEDPWRSGRRFEYNRSGASHGRFDERRDGGGRVPPRPGQASSKALSPKKRKEPTLIAMIRRPRISSAASTTLTKRSSIPSSVASMI
eukprot:scaffold1878_cov258-Pinguiococcus_pyrenoidosus.AAC.2